MTQRIIDFNEPKQEIALAEDTSVFGLYVGTGHSGRELDINIQAVKPEIHVNTLIKIILFDHAQINIRGNILIPKGNRRVDMYLKIAVLLMSPNARANVVPSLEIMETDVKGGHGATISTIDPEELFYLESKGISRPNAKNLLVDGFIQDIYMQANSEVRGDFAKELTKINSTNE